MPTYEAILMSYNPESDYKDPSKGGFKTEKEAWKYINNQSCDDCKRLRDDPDYGIDHCAAEWDVFEEELNNQ